VKGNAPSFEERKLLTQIAGVWGEECTKTKRDPRKKHRLKKKEGVGDSALSWRKKKGESARN